MNSFPYLSAVIVVPLIGALITASVPKSKPKQAKYIAFGFSAAVAAITIAAWASYDTGETGMQLTEHYSWVPDWGLNLSFGMDGIALVMLALTALLTPIVILASWNDANKRNQPTFFALILALQATMIGTFISTNVLLFYIFFEVMLVPMYFLIGSYGGKRRQYAAVKFFLYSLLGGMVLLAAIIGLWVATGGVFDFATLTDGKHTIAEGTLQNWLFLGFFIAFAIKAPFFPFHTWLPDAGGAAPAGIAALLVGVMDKIGTFAILRYCLPLFPDASQLFAPLAIALALVGVIYGALVAIGQKDLRRLVAYTSIAHFGFIGVGIFAFTHESASGAVLYMVNHGLATGLLFIVVGMLATRRGSSDIADFGGAGKMLPLLAGTFFIAGLASLALPGTAPFVSEFLILLGTYSANKPVAVIATLGVILAAAYVLWMYQRTMQGTVNAKLDGVKAMKRDLNLREKLVVAPLIAGILVLGIYPQPVLDVINPAVEHTLDSVGVTGSADQAATGENK